MVNQRFTDGRLPIPDKPKSKLGKGINRKRIAELETWRKTRPESKLIKDELLTSYSRTVNFNDVLVGIILGICVCSIIFKLMEL